MRKMSALPLMICMGILASSINPRLPATSLTTEKTCNIAPTGNNTNINAQSQPSNTICLAASGFHAIDTISMLTGNINIYLPIIIQGNSFSFASWGDAQDNGTHLPMTSNQIAALNPDFTIFNGDLESNGFDQSQMDIEIAALNGGSGNNNGLFYRTFLVRGNHDNNKSGSADLWEKYFTIANRLLPSGVTNYIALDSSSTYLTYSFDYGNSRFIGADVPGEANLLTTAEATFIDGRLVDAEEIGLKHAFLFFHGPEYCVTRIHCNCSSANDSRCTPDSIINLINKHPIVSATFHGHEHILGWVHMSNARIPGLTHEYEEFLTSPSGESTYNSLVFPARLDYVNMANARGFSVIQVNEASFTVSLYRVGTIPPVWSKTFSH